MMRRFSLLLLYLFVFSSCSDKYYKSKNNPHTVSYRGQRTVVETKKPTHIELTQRTKALVEAGATRIRPILLTTLTTVISMIPMALGYGNDMLQGLALVNVGGLIASTLLSLLLLPTLYKMIDKAGRRATGESLTEGLDID